MFVHHITCRRRAPARCGFSGRRANPVPAVEEPSVTATIAQRLRAWPYAAAVFLLVTGCTTVLTPIGPDGPFPDPPIDFSRALELAQLDADITENQYYSPDDLRARYTTDDVEVKVFSTVLPGDDGETRFVLLTDYAQLRQTLALGGTDTYRQWQVDAMMEPMYQADLGANVHTGWNMLSLAVLDYVLPELRTDYTLTVTGFSLGGALTAITSKYLMQAGYRVTEVVTFGQPRVTDTAGVDVFSDVPITRFVNDKDPFPHMKGDGSAAAHFGRMVLLYDGPDYAYVPAGDPNLEADAQPFDSFTAEDFEYHSETLYVDRLSAKVSGTPVQVVFQP